MREHEQKARELFTSGYNCAQSTFCAFADDLGLDFETALKLSSSFGGGMGRLREVCGAVSAMFMIAGLKHGYTTNNDDLIKEKHYQLIQNLAQKFKEKNKNKSNVHRRVICRYTEIKKQKANALAHRANGSAAEKRPDAVLQNRGRGRMFFYDFKLLTLVHKGSFVNKKFHLYI